MNHRLTYGFPIVAFALTLFAVAGAGAQETTPPPEVPVHEPSATAQPPAGTPEQPGTPPPAQAQAPAGIDPSTLTIPQLLELADMARENKRFQDAMNIVNLIVQREGGQRNIDVLRMLGDIAYDMKNADEARNYWLMVRKIQPADFGANWGLGSLELESGQPRNALYYLQAAEQVIPADKADLAPLVLIKLAQAYEGTGQRAPALDAVGRALKLDPKRLEGWYVLTKLQADMARTAEDFDKALGSADQLLTITDAEIQSKGYSPITIQQKQVAYQLKLSVLFAYRTILFLRNPDGQPSDRPVPGKEPVIARILSNSVDILLQQIELDRLLRHFQIVDMAQEVVRLDGGTNADTLMKLADLQNATGQYPAALQTYQRVLELDPLHKEAQRQIEAIQARIADVSASMP